MPSEVRVVAEADQLRLDGAWARMLIGEDALDVDQPLPAGEPVTLLILRSAAPLAWYQFLEQHLGEKIMLVARRPTRDPSHALVSLAMLHGGFVVRFGPTRRVGL